LKIVFFLCLLFLLARATEKDVPLVIQDEPFPMIGEIALEPSENLIQGLSFPKDAQTLTLSMTWQIRQSGGSVCGIDGDCDGSLLDPGEECDDGNSDTADGCVNCTFVEFQVNTWTTDRQENPSITSLSNGGFVVVWTSGCSGSPCTNPQDGSGDGVYGRIFSQ
jgi:hypothetical protein